MLVYPEYVALQLSLSATDSHQFVSIFRQNSIKLETYSELNGSAKLPCIICFLSLGKGQEF